MLEKLVRKCNSIKNWQGPHCKVRISRRIRQTLPSLKNKLIALLTMSYANSCRTAKWVNSELQEIDEWMRYNKLSL